MQCVLFVCDLFCVVRLTALALQPMVFFSQAEKNSSADFTEKFPQPEKKSPLRGDFPPKRPPKISPHFAAIFFTEIDENEEEWGKIWRRRRKFLDPNEEKTGFLLIFRRKFLIFPPQLRKFSSQTSKYPMLPSSGRFPQLAEKFPQFCEMRIRKKTTIFQTKHFVTEFSRIVHPLISAWTSPDFLIRLLLL